MLTVLSLAGGVGGRVGRVGRRQVRGQRIAVFAASDVIDAAFLQTWPATATRAGLATAKDLDRLTGAVRAWRPEGGPVPPTAKPAGQGSVTDGAPPGN